MNIEGKIIGIRYEPLLVDKLKDIDIKAFDINKCPAVFLMKITNNLFAISKWVSPKRTRSYPFERVYDSLSSSKKITIIPIVKDEGAEGERDFIQWDTISLMSLLDVFVIFAYYYKAEISSKNNKKITKQEFDNNYILTKIKEIQSYHSSSLHWNLNELNCNFHKIVDLTKSSYLNIEQLTKVSLHSVLGIDKFKEKIGKDLELFMQFSRDKAEKAQEREFHTLQPKESLSSHSKAKITITNYLGGKYFFTVDEVEIRKNNIYLIECKHSKNSLLPSRNDIKDGLLKMILYCNLSELRADNKSLTSFPILLLSSSKLKGSISSLDNIEVWDSFFDINHFSTSQRKTIDTLLKEAAKNKFIIKLQYSK